MAEAAALPACATVDGLRATLALLRRQNDPVFVEVAAGLARYLDPFSNETLDAALGLHPAPGVEHCRTVGC